MSGNKIVPFFDKSQFNFTYIVIAKLDSRNMHHPSSSSRFCLVHVQLPYECPRDRNLAVPRWNSHRPIFGHVRLLWTANWLNVYKWWSEASRSADYPGCGITWTQPNLEIFSSIIFAGEDFMVFTFKTFCAKSRKPLFLTVS